MAGKGLVADHGGVVLITIDRPGAGNAVAAALEESENRAKSRTGR